MLFQIPCEKLSHFLLGFFCLGVFFGGHCDGD
jgi:hypothetical protein